MQSHATNHHRMLARVHARATRAFTLAIGSCVLVYTQKQQYLSSRMQAAMPCAWLFPCSQADCWQSPLPPAVQRSGHCGSIASMIAAYWSSWQHTSYSVLFVLWSWLTRQHLSHYGSISVRTHAPQADCSQSPLAILVPHAISNCGRWSPRFPVLDVCLDMAYRGCLVAFAHFEDSAETWDAG